MAFSVENTSVDLRFCAKGFTNPCSIIYIYFGDTFLSKQNKDFLAPFTFHFFRNQYHKKQTQTFHFLDKKCLSIMLIGYLQTPVMVLV